MSEEKVVLEKRVAELENKLERVHEVVYQLLGGLFNQSSQSDILNVHLSDLFGREKKGDKIVNIWPTTRQGDENTKRLDENTKRLDENTKRLDELEKMIEKKVENEEVRKIIYVMLKEAEDKGIIITKKIIKEDLKKMNIKVEKKELSRIIEELVKNGCSADERWQLDHDC